MCSGAPISTPVNHVVLVSPCPCEANLCRQSDVSEHDVNTLSFTTFRSLKTQLDESCLGTLVFMPTVMYVFVADRSEMPRCHEQRTLTALSVPHTSFGRGALIDSPLGRECQLVDSCPPPIAGPSGAGGVSLAYLQAD